MNPTTLLPVPASAVQSINIDMINIVWVPNLTEATMTAGVLFSTIGAFSVFAFNCHDGRFENYRGVVVHDLISTYDILLGH